VSYEGYEVWLCQNGHEHVEDCYMTPDTKTWECPDCGAGLCWTESVDETNGPGIRLKLQVFEEAEHSTCECCGVTRQVKEERFYIPANTKHGDTYGPTKYFNKPLVPTCACKITVEDGEGREFDTIDEAWKAVGY